MEKMVTGAIRAYTNDANATVSINQYVAVPRKPTASSSSASAPAPAPARRSVGSSRSPVSHQRTMNSAPSKSDDEKTRRRDDHSALAASPTAIRKTGGGLRRKLSVLGAMNKRKSRSPTSPNLLGVSRIVEAS
jgi:hypothetical protein